MGLGDILQIIMVATGIVLLIVTVGSLARRRMTDSFCLAWGLIALILVLAGIFLRPSELARYISTMGLLMVVAIGFCVVYVAYFMSIKVSELARQNQELAIQVSLLVQENECILERMERMESIVGQQGKEDGSGRDGEIAYSDGDGIIITGRRKSDAEKE